MNFASIRSEGALFSDDLLKRIAGGEPSLGQKAADFGLDARARGFPLPVREAKRG